MGLPFLSYTFVTVRLLGTSAIRPADAHRRRSVVADAAGYPSFVGSRDPTNRHLGAVIRIDVMCPSRNSGFIPADDTLFNRMCGT